jgi:hypothetical protein
MFMTISSKHRKAIATIPTVWILAFFAIGAGAVIVAFFYANYFDVKIMMKEARIERDTINLVQGLLSYYNLTYNDEFTIHRAVLSADKLDKLFKKGKAKLLDFDWRNEILEADFGYPDTVSMIYVADLETGNIWHTFIRGPSSNLATFDRVMSCLRQNQNLGLDAIFSINPNFLPGGIIAGPHDIWDLAECQVIFATSRTVAKGFPVAIHTGDDVHIGRISAAIMEMPI